ncbi:tetratricopeptide repeat protein [Rothia terrae]|uniref:tetratricopeptide repeat protein n=1 Tax=Rothia terrae TaxID=396015 RepID=UPI0028827815|nr:hypothetical protein [Rothia terrae]MDT0190349.1 hypothetical protein [Rothia terrae]
MAEYSRRDSKKNFGSNNSRNGFKKRSERSSFGNRDENRDRRRNDRDGYAGKRGDNNDRKFNKNARTSHNEDKRFGGRRRGGEGNNARRGTKHEDGSYTPPVKVTGPDIDTDVTGKELDGSTLRQLRALESQNSEAVAKHLVMAGRYLEIDPQFALEHAKYATKRAGRIAAVREAAGIAAYVAEDFEMSLRELRTHRRISGSNEHIALLIDNERALGRIEKALELAEEALNDELQPATRVEVSLVVSGIKHDAGDLDGALKALEIPELNKKRGFEYSPRLFSAYADLLTEAGRRKEAQSWMRLAVMTEAALGQGDFIEPEIFDIFTEQELLEPEEKFVDLSEESEKEVEAEQPTENTENPSSEEGTSEITEDSSVDEDITLEPEVLEALSYTDEDAAEDRLTVVENEEGKN